MGKFRNGSELFYLEDESLRLWSIHPQYLDRMGLVALWRESLLAQKVLRGDTKGYRNHPQLKRFRNHPRPLKAIAQYLIEVWEEGRRRGYKFNQEKISEGVTRKVEKIPVTKGQLRHELNWLGSKLQRRDHARYQQLSSLNEIECHPSFELVEGDSAEGEQARAANSYTNTNVTCTSR